MSAEALAQALGTHAVVAFCAALAVLVVLAAVLAVGAGRIAARSARGGSGPAVALLLPIGLGFAVLLSAGAVFAEMLEALDVADDLGRFDVALARGLHAHLPPAAVRAFAAVTHLGDPETLTVLCAVVALGLWWRRERLLACGWVVALAGNALLNPMLKGMFERVRPPHAEGVAAVAGFSFPSGHSSGALVAYGMLGFVLLRLLPRRLHPAVLATSAALAFTVGSSRVMLQVHYASDVVAGFASGLAWLAVCTLAVELLERRLAARRRPAPAA